MRRNEYHAHSVEIKTGPVGWPVINHFVKTSSMVFKICALQDNPHRQTDRPTGPDLDTKPNLFPVF